MGFVKAGSLSTWYLGASIVSGRFTGRNLEPLVIKFQNKIAGWKWHLLSQGGQLILLKHVLSCMVTHLLAVLDVPKMMLNKLNSILSNFFWGESKRKWVSWSHMCKPMLEGEIGVRNFSDVQKAMHMKFA